MCKKKNMDNYYIIWVTEVLYNSKNQEIIKKLINMVRLSKSIMKEGNFDTY